MVPTGPGGPCCRAARTRRCAPSFKSGLAYGDLAQELGRARAPGGFTHDQRDLYKEQLVEKSQPLLDHARQALMEAIGRARDAGTSPGCLADARHSLVQLWAGALWEAGGGHREAAAGGGEAGTGKRRR